MSRLFRRGDTWWCDYQANGRRIRKSTRCTDRSIAQVVLGNWLKDRELARAGMLPVEPKYRDAPIREHLRDWVSSLIAQRPSEGRRAYVVKAERAIAEMIDALKWRTLGDMQQGDIERYFNRLAVTKTRRGQMPAPNTIENRIGYLHSFCRWCVKKKKIVDNPCCEMPRTAQAREQRRAMTLEELRQLLCCQDVPEHRRLSYLVMVLLGLRRQQARYLTAQMIRFDNPGGPVVTLPYLAWTDGVRVGFTERTGMSPVRLMKSGKAMTIPIPTELVPALQALGHGIDDDRPILAPNLESRVYKADLRRAGVSPTDADGRTLVLHSTRKTGNSLMAAVGVGAGVRMQYFGWSAERLASVTYLDGAILPTREASARLGAVVFAATRESGGKSGDVSSTGASFSVARNLAATPASGAQSTGRALFHKEADRD